MSGRVPVFTRENMKTLQIMQRDSKLVYKAANILTGQYVFLKPLPTNGLNEREVQDLFREVECIRQIRSEHLEQILGVFRSPNIFGILTDWMENGSLHFFIHQRKLYPKLPPYVCVQILTDTAEGLHHLHSLPFPVMHKDLKPSKILLDEHYRAKISDHGLSQALHPVPSEVKDGIVYLSPQRIQGYAPTMADDVYSLVITAWETFSREIPFNNISHDLKLATYITEGCRPQTDIDLLLKETDISDAQRQDLAQFVRLGWHQDPCRRPTMSECLKHLQCVCHSFSRELMKQSVNILNENKRMAEQCSASQVHEFDIACLDLSNTVSNSTSTARGRAQSVPYERDALLVNDTEQHKGQRSGLDQSERFTVTLKKKRESILCGVTEGKLNQILDNMRSMEVISRCDYEHINSKRTLTDKMRECLDTCYEKGEDASQAILEVIGSYRFG